MCTIVIDKCMNQNPETKSMLLDLFKQCFQCLQLRTVFFHHDHSPNQTDEPLGPLRGQNHKCLRVQLIHRVHLPQHHPVILPVELPHLPWKNGAPLKVCISSLARPYSFWCPEGNLIGKISKKPIWILHAYLFNLCLNVIVSLYLIRWYTISIKHQWAIS